MHSPDDPTAHGRDRTVSSEPAPETGDSAQRSTQALTAGGLLARNTVWTLLGQMAPLLGALVAIPILVRELGTDRFGMLTLAWAVIGYMSLLDLGLGRALTQRVAGALGAGREQEVARDSMTALTLMGALGAGSGLFLFAFAPGVTGLLQVPPGLEAEATHALRWVAVSVPFVLLTAGLAGILSAYQRFAALNALRIPSSLLSFFGPLAVVAFSPRLDHVVASLAAIRVAGTVAHGIVTLRVVPRLREGRVWDVPRVWPMVRLGGWMTVSNLISPVMVQMDRFLVGAWGSLSLVAFYATPYEIATRLWIVSGPIVTVLFPALGTALVSDRERARFLYGRSVTYVWLVLCPIVIAVIALARDGIGLWLGSEFAARSTVVLQWLAVGILANSVGQMAYALVHAAGRARDAALLHVAELPLYLFLVWGLMQWRGIEGVAWAWCARMVVDALALLVLARRAVGGALVPGGTGWGFVAGLTGIAGAFAVQTLPFAARAGYAALGIAVGIAVAGSPGMVREREALLALFRRPGGRATAPMGKRP